MSLFYLQMEWPLFHGHCRAQKRQTILEAITEECETRSVQTQSYTLDTRHSSYLILNVHIKIPHWENTGIFQISNAWKCVSIQKTAFLIFSRVKSEENRHPVVVFLIINESPASSAIENRQEKHWPLSPSESFLSPSSCLNSQRDMTLLLFILGESNHILFL